MNATALSPGHITGFFRIFSNGSTGAGFNISKGAITRVDVNPSAKNKVVVLINGRESEAKTSRNVAESFLSKQKKKFYVKVLHSIELPIGYGLGLSGAGALSLSMALNEALSTKLPQKKALEIAKKAEISAGTGLGDVIAEQHHGLMMGKKPYPSKKVEIIPIKENFAVLGFFSPIKTSNIIRNSEWKQKINKAGEKAMQKFGRKKNFSSFIECCREFTIETGLASRAVERFMEKVPDSSQAMLGQTVFALTNNPTKTGKEFKKHCRRVAVTKIAGKGAMVL